MVEENSQRRGEQSLVCPEKAVVEAVVDTSQLLAAVVDTSRGSPGRGLKRKLECVDAGTKIGIQKKFVDDFDLGRVIGEGVNGSVRLCTSKANGVEFACKTLSKVDKKTDRQEIEIMQHLFGHPGVVTLNAVYEDTDCFHLVMELCSGGDLFEQIVNNGPCSESQAALMFKELIVVIKYCHEKGVVHRDIKPENVFLTSSGKMKLADFGLAAWITTDKLSGVVGSPVYVAPEVLVGDYSEKVDIWSAGVLLHVLLVGELPFQANTKEAIDEAHKKENLNINSGIQETISRPARDLLRRMLTRDASLRLSADEVLRHPWFMCHTEQLWKPTSNKPKERKVLEDLSNQLASPKLEVNANKFCRAF